MSYAEVASKGPKQSPKEAAAPQPPQVNPTTTSTSHAPDSPSTASSSLIDVDTPSVRTVPSTFASQEIKTDTQAARVEREAAAEAAAAEAEEEEEEEERERARAEADLARKNRASAAAKAKEEDGGGMRSRAEGWIVQQWESVAAGGPGVALALANVLAVVGLGGWLGFRAWRLYDRGRLGWREAGIGLAVLGAVGAVEGVLASYFSKKVKSEEQ
ncbi:uncharacterized protein THITE_2116219 [Thermothielavioides terrestris NRRL 8126]|uniref:Uncharacterized protein n=1 Tax=Thermothielavioides terrestris (strain ATCC 38088 / NRRL 8126) TaxID=578455 RepID=G2R0R9_THETT|nr:uncharacterized protein THITE_2116219 [Thermothielavioides terrestris NRRL 8126]AEO67330.1 hypothetical protein THITE_2116219 [Thermothielavioides terrestris NRRL 8126]